MLAGLILKQIFRLPLKLVFTSASQRNHSKYTRWLIQKMDAIIATSEATNSYLKRPAKVILHGIDLNRFQPVADREKLKRKLQLPTDKRLLGCIGRIRHQKGTDIFVDSLISLLREDKELVGCLLYTSPSPRD